MPFKNPEDRRRYDRERRRRLRAVGDPAGPALAAPIRMRVIEDLESLLAEAVSDVRADAKARGTEKARALGYLVSIGLRLVEVRDLENRVEALEGLLSPRRTA